MLIHLGIKPFSCGKQFKSRENWNDHWYIHSDKKPYICLECGAGFMRNPLLLGHMNYSKDLNDTIIVNQPQVGLINGTLPMNNAGDDDDYDDIVEEIFSTSISQGECITVTDDE